MSPFRLATIFGKNIVGIVLACGLLVVGWVVFGLLVAGVSLLADWLYGIHWILAAPIRLLALVMFLGWIIGGILTLLALPVMVVAGLRRDS